MRVYELAKELDIPSKELTAKIQAMGIEVKNHMSTLDDKAVASVKSALSEKAAPKAQPEKKSTPAPKPTVAKKPAAAPESPAKTPPQPAPEAQPQKAAPEQQAATQKPAPETAAAPEPAESQEPSEENVIHIRGGMQVREVAEAIGVKPNLLITELMKMNILASINERLDAPVIKTLIENHGFTAEQDKRAGLHPPAPVRKDLDEDTEPEDADEDLQPRPPVVTFLGHVDHGKTSLLDCIRKSQVAAGESGGITQHIGAYSVDVSGRPITFLDTPGHAAFTAMRARGANVTDIAVIIVAADDGIMPQTREAIQHAKAAGVAIMVAMNKMDLPQANEDRIKQQLQAEGLAPEDWGGDTICCPVSATTGNGINHLLEMILLQADILELKANPRRRASGFVIEARLEPGRGPTANLLVKRGTLKVGDVILCGEHSGRVRALINDKSETVKSAGPSMPVKCLGLSGVPEAGAEFNVYRNEKLARVHAREATQRNKQDQLTAPRKASLEALFDQIKSAEKQELKAIIKADTQGSVEAISHSLAEINSEKINLNILLGGTGNITTNDVMLASASDAVILGFHVAKESGVDSLAKREGVQVKLHQVIYELIDEVREAMTGMLAPATSEKITGHAEIRQVFTVGKRTRVAGCMMIDGFATNRSRIRVKRKQETIYEGKVSTLRHFQDEVPRVREAQECGIQLDNFGDFQEGDILEAYEIESVTQTL